MSLKSLEDNAEHLFRLVKHAMQTEINMNGVAHYLTQEFHDVLEAHVALPVSAAAATIVSAPVVEAPVVVVEAPQTVAQEQSASNKAN